jgi:nitroreductase/Pyruvate/2-oxoacid:ferredoxin oxidoreductase delta subunit
MTIKGVDRQKCTLCLECVKDCPAQLFSLTNGAGQEKAVKYRDPHRWCLHCGHCLSVCRNDAVLYESDQPAFTFKGIEDPASLCGYERLLQFLQSKRSVRRYRDRDVPREVVEAVLGAMQYAPTGHNLQANRYLVITDKAKIQPIIEETARMFSRFKTAVKHRRLFRPFVSKGMYEVMNAPGLEQGLEDLIEKCDQGQDPIFHSAPTVVVVYYPNLGELSLLDPTIALTYGMLAAHSLGLGTCWIGFAVQSLFRNKRMKRLLGIGDDMIVAGVMSLGYPAVQYHRIPPRKDLEVSWLG